LISIARPAGHALAEESHFEVEQFPLQTAGMPIPCSDHALSGFEALRQNVEGSNEFAPFQSRLDWNIAQWARMCGPSSSAMTELLELEGVCSQLFIS
jgi:hypothetical protein